MWRDEDQYLNADKFPVIRLPIEKDRKDGPGGFSAEGETHVEGYQQARTDPFYL